MELHYSPVFCFGIRVDLTERRTITDDLGSAWKPLGFVQDAQDVMVLFDEWLAVLGLCSVRVLDEPTAGRDACMS